MSVAIADDEDFEYMMEDTWGFEVVRYDEDGDEVKKVRSIDERSVRTFSAEATLAAKLVSFRPSQFGEEAEKAVSNSIPEDPYQADIKEVCELIFSPPCDFQELIVRIGASQVSACPSLTLAQFMSTLSTLARKAGKELTAKRAAELVDSVLQSIQKGGGMIDVSKLHGLMALRFGGSGGTGSIIELVKAKMLKRAGSDGLRAIHRVMKIMDDDGSKVRVWGLRKG